MTERTCKVVLKYEERMGEECGRKHKAHGMCDAHYKRVKRTGDPQADKPIQGRRSGRVCEVVLKYEERYGEECGRPHEAHSRCVTHDWRVRNHGDVQADKPIREQYKYPLDALMARHEVDPDTGCWNWTGAKKESGHGHMKSDGKDIRAHRFAWAKANYLTLDDIEDDWICHLCHNPSCVNPRHLYRGSAQTNAEDRELTDLSIEELRELRV